MSDLQHIEALCATKGVEFDPEKVITVPIKNGAGVLLVYPGLFNDDVYREALIQGVKVLGERGMSKMTKEAYPDEEERKAAIHEKAKANVQDMYEGKVKLSGGKAKSKASGAVMVEAMRLARNLVKDAMKANKIKISHVKASEITATAKQLLESDPSIIQTAEANLKAREATPIKIDIASLIKTDAELVRKDEAKKAKAAAEKPLSKAQAGKVAPRAKAKAPAHHTAH